MFVVNYCQGWTTANLWVHNREAESDTDEAITSGLSYDDGQIFEIEKDSELEEGDSTSDFVWSNQDDTDQYSSLTTKSTSIAINGLTEMYHPGNSYVICVGSASSTKEAFFFENAPATAVNNQGTSYSDDGCGSLSLVLLFTTILMYLF